VTKRKQELLELVVGVTKKALRMTHNGAGLRVIRNNPEIRAAFDDPKFVETLQDALTHELELWVGAPADGDSIETVEHRLRETLKRRGYRLEKSRRRDPHALTYGRYWIILEKQMPYSTAFLVPASEGDPDRAFTMTLDQVDAWCRSGKKPDAKINATPAWKAYVTERQETMPSKAAFRGSMPVAPGGRR